MNPGDILDGRYRILSLIGEGTFAYVYRARHLVIDSLEIAIKVLKPDFVADDALRQQFVHEAETVAMLRNTHTVRVTDMGRLTDGRPYIGMEYCAGLTLNQLARLYGPISTPTAAHIADGVLQSLREAHELRIIHRDIKPSNVMLTSAAAGGLPLVRVLDFGIAHAIQTHNVAADDASSNFVFCTPSYAAPEVLHGQPSKSADFYALGLTLAELIEGEPVYPNDGFYKVAARQTSNEPVPFGPETRRNPLFPVLERACRKAQGERYGSAEEMLQDLRRVARGLDYRGLRRGHYPPPIGCGSPEQCAVCHDVETLARATVCPHPACNLRLNTAVGGAPALSNTHISEDFGTLRAALAMESADLAFDLDAFTDTEVRPRITEQPFDSLDDALSDEVPTARFLRGGAADIEETYHTERARSYAAPAEFLKGNLVSVPKDRLPSRSTDHALRTGPAPFSVSFIALQRTLLPVSSHANARGRIVRSVLAATLLLTTLLCLLFTGFPYVCT